MGIILDDKYEKRLSLRENVVKFKKDFGEDVLRIMSVGKVSIGVRKLENWEEVKNKGFLVFEK